MLGRFQGLDPQEIDREILEEAEKAWQHAKRAAESAAFDLNKDPPDCHGAIAMLHDSAHANGRAMTLRRAGFPARLGGEPVESEEQRTLLHRVLAVCGDQGRSPFRWAATDLRQSRNDRAGTADRKLRAVTDILEGPGGGEACWLAAEALREGLETAYGAAALNAVLLARATDVDDLVSGGSGEDLRAESGTLLRRRQADTSIGRFLDRCGDRQLVQGMRDAADQGGDTHFVAALDRAKESRRGWRATSRAPLLEF